MSLRQLSLNNFRNIHPTTLDFHPEFNLITGLNASGKTNLLEALHIVCQGQSFKTKKIDQCIHYDHKDFLIFSRFNRYKAGFSRTKNQSVIKIDGKVIKRLSELASYTPIRVINNESFYLVNGQPGLKRDYIDWCLFHVEHNYQKIKSEYSHALKQRNTILRTKKNINQIIYWDKYLIEHGMNIYQLRNEYLITIQNILTNELSLLTKDLCLSFSYLPGWDVNKTLDSIFKDQQSRDLYLGYTRYGIHRDDIEILSNGYSAKDNLSRGQQKRVAIALIIAQIFLLKLSTDKPLVLLVDDIASELDNNSLTLVFNLLKTLGIQLFVTNISDLDSTVLDVKEYKMFHVEHGMIKAIKR